MIEPEPNGDLLAIPPFLIRKPEAVAPPRAGPKPHRGAGITMPAISATFYREREAEAQEKVAKHQAALELKQKRFTTKAFKAADRQRVLKSIGDGSETWGQIVASLGLDASRLRSALRALVKDGLVVKLSTRRYGLA